MSDKISEPRRIETDLDHTRTRLDRHLSELQQRLTPGQVLDDLMRYFRGREGADFGRGLMESVRSNPMPAAITGIGMAWLMASNTRPGAGSPASGLQAGQAAYPVSKLPAGGTPAYGDGGFEAMTARMQSAEQGIVRNSSESGTAYKSRLDDARGKAIGLARHTDENTDSFSERILDALSAAQRGVVEGAQGLQDRAAGAVGTLTQATQSAGSMVGNAAKQAGGALGQGGHAAGQIGGNLVSTVAESPILLGALSLAAGALLGALLPQSDQEEAALGEIAAQARGTVREFAQDAVHKSTHVAKAVMDKAQDSAEAHGLTGGKSPGGLVDAAMSGDLSNDAKQVAEDILHAGEDAIRKESVSPTSDPSAS